MLRSGPARSDQSIVLGMGIYARPRSLVRDVVVVPLKKVELEKMSSFGTG